MGPRQDKVTRLVSDPESFPLQGSGVSVLRRVGSQAAVSARGSEGDTDVCTEDLWGPVQRPYAGGSDEGSRGSSVEGRKLRRSAEGFWVSREVPTGGDGALVTVLTGTGQVVRPGPTRDAPDLPRPVQYPRTSRSEPPREDPTS